MKVAAQERAVALVIVLAFVVLLTGLVVAFMSRATLGVQSSNASANTTRAEVFCQGSINQLIGDLKQEIAAGSTVVTRGATTVYLPTSSSGARQNILPYPVNSLSGTTCANPTLVKESLSKQPFFAGSTYNNSANTVTYTPSNRASSALSTTSSVNGRSVSLARWNKPMLLPVTSDADATPTGATNFQAPNWVYVARDGSNPTDYSSGLADSTSSTLVLGRYSYVIYDESALLDVNAAGFPSNTTSAQINAKGSPGLADLTATGLQQSDVDTLVGWRNYASGQPSGNFPSYTFSFNTATNYYNLLMGISGGTLLPTPVSGKSTSWEGVRKTAFLTVGNQGVFNSQSDRIFGSRQELIRMLMHDIAQNSSDRARMETALPNLGTFSRTVNAPSWVPVTPTGSSIDYAKQALAQAQNPGASTVPANQIAASVLVKTSFTRDDGTVAQVGDPLIKSRFPLRRLEWFNTANQGLDAAKVEQKWFAMQLTTPKDGTWNLLDPDNNYAPVASLASYKIDTLDKVAAQGREPTFWEMLQAAILSGSLAPNYVDTTRNDSDPNANSSPFKITNDAVPIRHLLQIGLNIIDQYNSNITPTVLAFGTQGPITDLVSRKNMPIAGVKNLPYLMMMSEQVFPTKNPPQPIYNFVGYLQFLLWNPHVNAAAMANGASLKFRFVTDTTNVFIQDPIQTQPNPVSYSFQSAAPTSNPQGINFHATGQRFSTIDLLTPSDAVGEVAPLANCTYPLGASAGAAKQLGVFYGYLTETSNPPTFSGFAVIPTNMSHRLEVLDANNFWVPYEILPDWYTLDGIANWDPGWNTITNNMNTQAVPATSSHSSFDGQLIYAFSDPRTTRFGPGASVSSEAALKANFWTGIDNGTGAPTQFSVHSMGNFSPSAPVMPGAWPYNLNSSVQHYPGLDGIVRRGDGNSSIGFSTGNPQTNAGTVGATASPARPYFLGKSFNSVADMGYAGRDEPWKTLNFYSADSADGALLDYFSLSESPIRAGTININNASVPVLTAMLKGAYTDISEPNSALNDTAAQSIATALRNYLGATRTPTANVVYDPSDIGPIIQQVSASINGTTKLPAGLKRGQETVARALADSWNTRTWNLMIDVIAQTGRFPTSGNNTMDKFAVDGERRMWAHVAIDRITGKIVDFQLEPVTE